MVRIKNPKEIIKSPQKRRKEKKKKKKRQRELGTYLYRAYAKPAFFISAIIYAPN
jgi:hypothetical protein